MANHYGTVNLLSLFGAYATQDAQGKNVVVIPCDLNDIKLYTSQTTGKIIDAPLRINMNEMSESTRQSKAAKANKEGFVPPTHWMKLGLSKEAYEARVDSAAAKMIQKHPEWQGLNPRETRFQNGDYNPLNTEIRNVLYPIIGEMFTQGGAPVAFNGQAPMAQSAPQGGFQNTLSYQEENDLPF